MREQLIEITENLANQVDRFTRMGSGWILDKILHILVSVASYNPIEAGQFIKTPDWLLKKRALLNIVTTSEDPQCFLYGILAQLSPKKCR